MSSVLTMAHEAIKTANELTGKKTASGQEVVHNGRRYKHWSFYLLTIGAAVGVVTLIVASILKIYPLIVCGALLFITNALGAYYVQKFDTLHDLEDYVEVMSEKIKDLSSNIKELKEVNKGLKETHDKLQTNLKETKVVWEDGAKGVKSEADKIGELTKRLETTQKKLASMQYLYENLQNAVKSFSGEVSSLGSTSTQFTENTKKFAGKVSDAKEVLKTFDKENEEFDENNVLFDKLNKANLEFLNSFKLELGKIAALRKEADGLKAALEEKGGKLFLATKELSEQLARQEKINKERKQLIEEAERHRLKLEALKAEFAKMAEELKKQQTPK
jgi:chromosome segregation ATPase